MNYEEKFKNLVAAIKKLQDANPSDEGIQNWVNDNVPELAEPEDEATWLKKYVEEEISCLSIDIRDDDDRIKLENLKRSLAWLEKQGEQKVANSAKTCKVEPKFKVGDTIRLKHSNAEYVIESISNGRYYGRGFSIEISGGNRDYELVASKSGNWNEEDEDMIRYIGNAITCEESAKYLEEKGVDMIKAHRWLESHKPQPGQDWSEDDKRKISRIYSILGQAADTHAFSTSCRLIGDKECVELQDFLKSLYEARTSSN